MTSAQIEAQIFQLEKKAIKQVEPNSKKWYALNGKITKLKTLLKEKKHFEYLAQ